VENPFAFAPGEPGLFRKVVRLGGRPHLHLGIALANSAGREVLFVEAMYAVSEEVLSGITQGMLGSMGLVVLVVLATTLLLYPVIIQLLHRVTDLSAHLQEANLETLSVLGSAIAKRDSDTDLHNYRVTLYAVRLAEALELPPRAIRSLIKGALLHDVGKIGIRDAILLKPGRLDEAEFAEMRGHVQHGRDIVAPAAWLRDGLEVISGHHERYDGAGYDTPLTGPDIPLSARLFAIVDVFDALTSRRPYKEPLSCDESLAILAKDRGSHFDPEVLDAFLRIARKLYADTALCDEATLRERLRAVQRIYFTTDFDVMAESMEAGGPEA